MHADPSIYMFCSTPLMSHYSFLPERNHFTEPIPGPFLSRLKLAAPGLSSERSSVVLFSSHFVTDYIMGHSVRRRCGVEVLQKSP